MAYCPQCLTEYESWAKECIDCHAPLQAGSPPTSGSGPDNSDDEKDLELVFVRSFMGASASLNAALAKNVLDANGISSALVGENLARIFPLHAAVLLQVEKRNAERAEEILRDYIDKPTCPSADVIAANE